MDLEKFLCLVRRTPATHAIRLRFLKDSSGIPMLYRLCEERRIDVIHERDMIWLLMAVSPVRSMGGASALQVNVVGLPRLHAWELEGLGLHVESVEFTIAHGATELASPSCRKREEAARRIRDEVLSPSFRAELKEHGYFAEGGLEQFLGSFCLQFDVGQVEGDHTFKIRIDGWTGKMAFEEHFLNEDAYHEPVQAQRIIRSFLIKERHPKRRLALAA